MKGDAKSFLDFLESSEKFNIPVYQRNYDWKEANCLQLFQDIVDLHRSGRKNHFIGSVVTRQESLSSKVLHIIDGQQRVTTISLLLAALYNAAKDGFLKYESEGLLGRIYNRDLRDEYSKNERKVKLKPIKNDMNAFDNIIISSPDNYIYESNVTTNYTLFYEWIKQQPDLTLDDYYNAIEKLYIIDIRLDESDDPQLIFESLNSTGLDLQESDKIRNFLLMSLPQEAQDRCYNEYWNKIEIYTDYLPTMFVRDYLTIKLKKIGKIENLHRDFKQYFKTLEISREDILKDMLKFARLYEMVNKQKFDSQKVNRKVKQLCTIGISVAMPFFLSFVNYAQESGMSENDVYEVFDIVENYWARRIICNLPTNALNKVFCTLHSDIIKLQTKSNGLFGQQGARYAEVLKYILLRKQGGSQFPTDAMVKEGLCTRQIYHIPTEYRYFLFERLENGINLDGIVDVVGSMKNGVLTIEHIMPQSLSLEWMQALGPEAERIHQQYLHTFANLTLSACNINYGNHPFLEKLNGYEAKGGVKVNGLNESPLRLNAFVKTCTRWTETELIERQARIIKEFFVIWPAITTSFAPIEFSDNVSLDDDDITLTGRSITAFIYSGKKFKVSKWKDMLIQVCKLISENRHAAMVQLCKKDNYVHDHEKPACTKFAENCYVWSDNSTATKIYILKFLFEKMDIPYSDLVFELTPLADK